MLYSIIQYYAMRCDVMSDEEGHILVFLTGQEEVERACALIREEWRQHKAIRDENEGNGNGSGVNSSADRELVVLPLYAALPTEAQKLVFQKLEPPTNTTNKPLLPMTSCKLPRKCIVATNIAETSITVPHVRFVVDSGYTKQKTFDPARSMESLVVVPISQVSSDQRAGRGTVSILLLTVCLHAPRLFYSLPFVSIYLHAIPTYLPIIYCNFYRN